MSEDILSSDSIEARPLPHEWGWWSILSAHNQNVTADLEFVRIEIDKTRSWVEVNADKPRAAHGRELSEEQRILSACETLLAKCFASHRRFLFKNPLFVRQSILVILQELILIMPHSALHAAWSSIDQRYLAIDAKERPNYDVACKKVEGYFKECGCDKPGAKKPAHREAEDLAMEQTIRETMREIRVRLDDKVYIDYWNSVALQQKLSVLAPITVIALVAMMWSFFVENCGDISHLTSCFIHTAKDQHHIILTTTLAGLLGGAISALTPSAAAATSGMPPLVQFVAIRPLIGAAAGFFLAIVATETLTVTYPLLYGMAIAFGFSERAFVDALSKRAGQISASVGQGIGQSDQKDKRGE